MGGEQSRITARHASTLKQIANNQLYPGLPTEPLAASREMQ